MISYLNIFILSFGLAIVFTWLMAKLARRYKIVDDPRRAPERKKQIQPVPLLGGVAIFLAFTLTAALSLSHLLGGYLLGKYLVGIIAGGLILVFGGILDDRYNLAPKHQFVFPILASLAIVVAGIGVDYVTNPLGGVINLESIQFTVFTWQGLPYQITLLADLFTICWLLGMMYTTKFLDGLDGLVSGITVIGGLIIFWLSLSKEVWQPETAILALILSGASLGFLLFNWHPAKIYLGEGGSLICGFLLGVLAIISGGKIATALLILGLPIVDAAWVILKRVFWHKKSPFQGDREHLHFRLLDIGFSQPQAVLTIWLGVAVFGIASLFLRGTSKLWALLLLGLISLLISGFIVYRYQRQKRLDGQQKKG